MIKTLTTHGNSSALIIDKAILDLLHIDKSTPLEISTDGRSLIVSPVEDNKRSELIKSALKKVNKNHKATLQKLAE